MSNILFDSHRHYKRLVAAGSTPSQAEMLVSVVGVFRAQLDEYSRTPSALFDSHKFYKRLVEAGGTPAIAEAHLDVMRDLIAWPSN